MTFNLYRVILPVNNLDRAAEFYADVFDMPGERVSAGRHYFDCGGTILACYDPVADGDDLAEGWRHHPNQFIYLSVEDLEAGLDRVRLAGGEVLADIRTMPWGERVFYARDPSGNPIAFVEQRTVFRGGLPDTTVS